MKALVRIASALLVACSVTLGARGETLPAGADEALPTAEDAGAKKPEMRYGTEVMVLYATNSKKGIDSRIGSMPELKKPPFSAYDSYELLRKERLHLDKGEAKTLELPNGRVLKTKLVDVLAGDYLRLSASINQPQGKDFLPLLEVKAKVGQAFIVAGQTHKKGILVLVIRAFKEARPE